MRAIVGAALVMISIAPGTASAAPRRASPDLDRLVACRGLTDAAVRLACFDREAATIQTKLEEGQLAVIDQAQVREAQRQRFGLAASTLDLFTGKDGERLATLQSTVTNAAADQYGKWIVTLADGSRWHQIDDYPLAHAPGNGQAVTVSRAAVGSFRMILAHQAMRVRRDR